MPAARHRSAAARGTRAGLALGALVALAAGDAAADGERSPMIGASLVGGHGPDPGAEVVGVSLEAAWWIGRLGLALEGASRWDTDGDRALGIGASARLRLLERMLPSLLEPRDVELGLELHGVVERTWWDGDLPGDSRTARGLGLAVRLRGMTEGGFAPLLAESRLFVRAMSSPRPAPEVIARAMAPAEDRTRELTILIGIGAAFGAAEPRYLDRFRPRPLAIPGFAAARSNAKRGGVSIELPPGR